MAVKNAPMQHQAESFSDRLGAISSTFGVLVNYQGSAIPKKRKINVQGLLCSYETRGELGQRFEQGSLYVKTHKFSVVINRDHYTNFMGSLDHGQLYLELSRDMIKIFGTSDLTNVQVDKIAAKLDVAIESLKELRENMPRIDKPVTVMTSQWAEFGERLGSIGNAFSSLRAEVEQGYISLKEKQLRRA